MSKERAIRFCRKCHGYSDTLRKNQFPDYDSFKNHNLTYYDYLFLLRDFATAQAMQALELEINSTKNEHPNAAESSPTGKYINILEKSLSACGDCDYKNTMIVKVLTEEKEK